MSDSLGMVEVKGLVMAIEIADAMVKAANVRVDPLTRTKGNGWMTVKVFGDVGAVNAAVDCGRSLALQKDGLVSSKVIPRPIANIFSEKKLEQSMEAEQSNLAVKAGETSEVLPAEHRVMADSEKVVEIEEKSEIKKTTRDVKSEKKAVKTKLTSKKDKGKKD